MARKQLGMFDEDWIAALDIEAEQLGQTRRLYVQRLIDKARTSSGSPANEPADAQPQRGTADGQRPSTPLPPRHGRPSPTPPPAHPEAQATKLCHPCTIYGSPGDGKKPCPSCNYTGPRPPRTEG